MFGQLAPVGTGFFNLILDVNAVKEARYIPDTHRITDIIDPIDYIEENKYPDN
jgi:hypothetical protein